MKRILIIFLLLTALISTSFASSLVWWFKTEGNDKWLSSGIPFIIYISLNGENYLLGFNYPSSTDKDIKISEKVSLGYIIKKGMELKVSDVYTGQIYEKEGIIELKLKIFNLKKLKMETKIIKGENIENFLNSLSLFLYGNKNQIIKENEIMIVARAIKKYNSERLRIIKDGLKKFPDSIFLRKIYLKELIEEEDYESVVDFLTDPKTMKEYRTKIFSLIKLSDFEKAKLLLDKIETKKTADFNNFAISLILSNGNTGEAREYFMKAESFSPRDWRIYYNYSLFEYNQKDYKKAKEEIIKSINTSYKTPLQMELFKKIAQAIAREKERTLSLKNNPLNLLSILLSNISYFPPEKELTYLPILNEEIPIKKDTYYYKEGINALKNKNYFIAEKLLKRYLFHDPLNDNVYYALALNFFYKSQFEKSLEKIETALFIKERFIYQLLRLELFSKMNDIKSFDSLYHDLKNKFPANSDIDKVREGKNFYFPFTINDKHDL